MNSKIRELPEPIKTLARQNQVRAGMMYHNDDAYIGDNKTHGGFNWDSSPEGNDFWYSVYYKNWGTESHISLLAQLYQQFPDIQGFSRWGLPVNTPPSLTMYPGSTGSANVQVITKNSIVLLHKPKFLTIKQS